MNNRSTFSLSKRLVSRTSMFCPITCWPCPLVCFLLAHALSILIETDNKPTLLIDLVLSLLLGSQVRAMSTLLLPAVGGTRVVTGIAAAANLLLAVIFLGKNDQRGFNNTTTKTKHQVKGRLLLDVVVTQSSTIFQLLTSKDETKGK